MGRSQDHLAMWQYAEQELSSLASQASAELSFTCNSILDFVIVTGAGHKVVHVLGHQC
jgi:hypothetical protein